MNCFAFNMQGQRCELPAGHDGDHLIEVRWTDDECWTPSDTPNVEHLVEISEEELQASRNVPIYGGEGRPGTCLLCSHAMHMGECQRGNCDCRAGVPAG